MFNGIKNKRNEYFDIKDKPRDFLGLPLFNDQDFIIKKILKINKIDIRDEINRNLVFRNLEAQNILNADILGIIKDEHFRNEKILTNKEIDWLLTNFCGEFFLTKQFLSDLLHMEGIVKGADEFYYYSSEERKRFIYIFELKKIHIINLLSKSLTEKRSIIKIDINNSFINSDFTKNLLICLEKEGGGNRWVNNENEHFANNDMNDLGQQINFLIDNFNKVLVEINNIDNNIINNQTIEFLEGSSYKEHINNESFENELMDNISVFSHYSSERKQDFYNTPYVASHLYYQAILEIEKVLQEEISFLQSINIDNDQKNEINSKQEILNKISEAKEFVTWLLFALNYKTKFFFIERSGTLNFLYYPSYYGCNEHFLNSIKDVGTAFRYREFVEEEFEELGKEFFLKQSQKNRHAFFENYFEDKSEWKEFLIREEIINLDDFNNWDFSKTITKDELISSKMRFRNDENYDEDISHISNFYLDTQCYGRLKIKSIFFLKFLAKRLLNLKNVELQISREQNDAIQKNKESLEGELAVKNATIEDKERKNIKLEKKNLRAKKKNKKYSGEINGLNEEISRLKTKNTEIKKYEGQNKSIIREMLTEIKKEKNRLEYLFEETKKEKEVIREQHLLDKKFKSYFLIAFVIALSLTFLSVWTFLLKKKQQKLY